MRDFLRSLNREGFWLSLAVGLAVPSLFQDMVVGMGFCACVCTANVAVFDLWGKQ